METGTIDNATSGSFAQVNNASMDFVNTLDGELETARWREQLDQLDFSKRKGCQMVEIWGYFP